MKYEKPEIIAIDSACASIQSMGKFGSQIESDKEQTLTAYEADE